MKKTLLILCVLPLLTMLVFAYTIESATAHGHYIHPVSGVIEDPGNNPGIGQGMVENVVHSQALFEEVGGQLYACVRFNLANYISDVSFAVQVSGQDDFYAADYQVVKTTAETADYRFIVPSRESIVRASCFVEPMGRSVIFYINFSDFVAGNSDFYALGEGGKMQNVIKSNIADSETKINTQSVNDLMSAGQLGYEHGLLTNKSPQIRAILGDVIKPNSTEVEQLSNTSNSQWGAMTQALFNGVVLLFVLITFFCAVMATALGGLYHYLKLRNQLEAYHEDI